MVGSEAYGQCDSPSLLSTKFAGGVLMRDVTTTADDDRPAMHPLPTRLQQGPAAGNGSIAPTINLRRAVLNGSLGTALQHRPELADAQSLTRHSRDTLQLSEPGPIWTQAPARMLALYPIPSA